MCSLRCSFCVAEQAAHTGRCGNDLLHNFSHTHTLVMQCLTRVLKAGESLFGQCACVQMYFDRPLAESNISANNFEWYRTVFAPTAPNFIVEEQVCVACDCLTAPSRLKFALFHTYGAILPCP